MSKFGSPLDNMPPPVESLVGYLEGLLMVYRKEAKSEQNNRMKAILEAQVQWLAWTLDRLQNLTIALHQTENAALLGYKHIKAQATVNEVAVLVEMRKLCSNLEWRGEINREGN